jgi:two-component system, NtrC family, response regulator HydG
VIPPSAPDPHSPIAEARLVAISGPLSGEVLGLPGCGVRIGRDTSNDICLSDLALSRTHCTIEVVDGQWRIRDSQSSNGTFVNGAQVTDHRLSNRDRIELGESVFLFLLNAHPTTIPALLLEGPREPATRLRVDDTIYLRQSADPPATARAEHELRALLQISTTLNRLTTEDELHRQLLDLLAASLPAEQIALVAVGSDGDSRIVDARQLEGSPAVTVSQTVVSNALEERASLLTRGAAGAGLPTADGVASAAQSILCVPMVVRDRALGALYLTTSRTQGFDDGHLAFATAIANVAAIALDNVRQVAWLHRERARLQEDLERDHSLVGRSAAMRRIYEVVARVTRSDATVLITGETGSGKELVARAVHLNGARAKRPFVAINCAALTETLLETELFGHERGAFTGAVAQKKGKLEVADGGTVFLDEVGELAPALQSKLLRALELREFERVGGTRPVRVDIRLIAATNRKLPEDVAAGRFRSDLYHRLNVVEIHVPPLRERREDIPALASHFVERFSRKSAGAVRGIAPEALKYLMAYDWPGNVRELANTIERAIVLGASDHIMRDDLPDTLLQRPASDAIEGARFHETVRQAKVDVIVAAFREASCSYTEAARLLGLHPNYLHRLIRTLDIKLILERER